MPCSSKRIASVIVTFDCRILFFQWHDNEQEDEVSDNEDDCTAFVDNGGDETGDDGEHRENGYDETRNDNCDEDTIDITDVLCTTRSGRTCRSWKDTSLCY